MATKKKTAKKKTTKEKAPAKKAAVKKPIAKKAMKPLPADKARPIRVKKTGKLTQNQTYVILALIGILVVAIVYAIFITPTTPLDTITSPVIVATPTPIPPDAVILRIVTDESCKPCIDNYDNVADVMGELFPGLAVIKNSADSAEGVVLLATGNVKALPAYFFSANIAAHANFSQILPVLTEVGENYLFNERVRGMVVRYIEPPSAEGRPFKGSEDAKVTIVEFSDFMCSASKAFADERIPFIQNTYGDSVRIVFIGFPLSEQTVIPNEAARCAHDQGMFWEYHDALFLNPTLDIDELKVIAADVGLDELQFADCIGNTDHYYNVLGDRDLGVDYGVSGTPSVFINGIRIVGVPHPDDLKEIIDSELAK